jgi:hypothetical protein
LEANKLFLNNKKEEINYENIREYLKNFKKNLTENQFPHGCHYLHPQNESCMKNLFQVWSSSFFKIFPVYSLINLITILYQYKSFIKDKKSILTKSLFSITRTSLFLSFFNSIYQSVVCSYNNIFQNNTSYIYYIAGFVCSFSILLESNNRIMDLSLYTFTRALDSFYNILYKNLSNSRWKINLKINNFIYYLFFISISILNYFYLKKNQFLPYSINSFFNFLLN